MFRNRILMGAAHASNTRLLRRTAETTKFLVIIFLFLTQNVSHTCCTRGSNTISYKSNDGYASWVATQTTGVVSGTVAAATADDTHRLAKRMDLELCLSKYEIHKNTIIRTGESQTLGGKYLQGLELDTAEECQRLCCETESCDVYVFEDKSDGYCYLFECGPPENFHCKFTRHANYTSAVLTVARSVNEKTTAKPSVTLAKGTNSISQQEWELTSLKVKPDERDKQASTAVGFGGIENAASAALVPSTATIGGNVNVVATAGPVPMLGVEQIPPISVAFPQKVYPVQCGRFQFPCHSGECIAVYNACDGIPQCEDGSDEGPECSGVSSTAKANADAASSNVLDANGQKLPSVIQYQPTLPQQTMQQRQQVIQQQQQQVHQQQPQSVQQQALPAVAAPPLGNREDAGAWANRRIVQTEKDTKSVDLNSPTSSQKEGNQVSTTGVNANNMLSNAYSNVNSNNNNNNNNNVNMNLNSAYNAAGMQRNGIYVPQLADLTNGGVYIRQQQQLQQMSPPPQQQQLQQSQQYVGPQGNLMMPPNAQWQLQQQQQLLPQRNQLPQQQQQQTQQLPPYIITTGEQQPQLAQNGAKAAIGNEARVDVVGKTSLQQQPQTAGPQQIIQQSAVHVASSAAQTKTATQKPAAGKTGAMKAGAVEEYDDYDEEESTEPPKKKHKHKKPTNISPKSEKKKAHMDPIELALVEQRQHAPAPQPVHEQYKLIHENLGLEFRDHDGQSERPGGAMLSLTLGLLVTAALGILIGCRMRTVGRRTRRMGGKVPYSHEADFLVNGMYL